MGTNSAIQWCHHTFNYVRGCTKVSAGCANCYADKMSGRNPKTLGIWGKDGTRVVAAESYWKLPPKWNAAAKLAGERHRVFCASLADVFEGRESMPKDAQPIVEHARGRLFELIRDTPNLDWLLLTKRPENVRLLTPGWPLPENVWLGTSVEDQANADLRVPILLDIPATVRFLSCEPLLGPIEIWDSWMSGGLAGLHWVIVGGESGGKARPFDVGWARDIRDKCRLAEVACFVKQLGARPVESGQPWKLKDSHGGDWGEWTSDLRVREFPTPQPAAR